MPAIDIEEPSFSPDLFAFLRELQRNNNREWFAANKARYVADVQEPALAFIEDVGLRLPEVSGHFVADPRTVGGSLFRIYRDTRFSKDKTPYKTQVGIQFRHEGAKDAHAPGFYLHLEPSSVFMACGTWHPDSETLRAIRTGIASDAERWQGIVSDGGFADRFRLGGDTLKRPPAGFDRDHPLIEDIKRKDFIAIADLTDDDATSSEFLSRFLGLCAESGPFMRFLCDAARVPF
jgi:uncharacterized protein (TIGR02453 family)